jgi:hypothetical protein
MSIYLNTNKMYPAFLAFEHGGEEASEAASGGRNDGLLRRQEGRVVAQVNE